MTTKTNIRHRRAAPACEAPNGAALFAKWRGGIAHITDADHYELTSMLAKIELVHEPTWRAARNGNVSEAIGIALRNLAPSPDGGPGLVDVTMSAVALLARRGHPAATLIVEHFRTQVDKWRPLPGS